MEKCKQDYVKIIHFIDIIFFAMNPDGECIGDGLLSINNPP